MKQYPKNPNQLSFSVSIDRLEEIKCFLGTPKKRVGTISGSRFCYATRYKFLIERGWRAYYDNGKKIIPLNLLPFPSHLSHQLMIYFGKKDKDLQSYVYRDWENQPDDLFPRLQEFVSYLFHLGWIEYKKDQKL